MFREFYGLKEEAFGVTPDSRCFYPSRTHREALASLSYGLEAGRGFLALIARPGMGKTTLLFQLLEKLQTSTRTAFLFQTQCDSRELLHYLLLDLGFDTPGNDIVLMHNQLNEALARGMCEGKQFVLVVDEAQNLDDSVLETIRLLTDFETPRRKLLQIVLSGQPQLGKKLLRPSLSQLRQRIAMVSHLEPFTHEEVVQYVNHRLQTAGYRGGPLFDAAALQMVTSYSQGIPRNINNLCFNALSLGCALRRRTIDPEVLREVVADFDLNPLVQETALQAAVSAPIAGQTPSRPLRKLRSFVRPAALVPALLIAGLVSLSSLRGTGKKTTGGPISTPAPALTVARSSELSELRDAAQPTASSPTSWPKAVGEADHRDSPEETFTIIVRSRQTLRRISRHYFGRSSPDLIEQIAELNPELKDPARLKAGQSLRLPVLPRRQEQTSEGNDQAGVAKSENQQDD